jgi:hypothetical protein
MKNLKLTFIILLFCSCVNSIQKDTQKNILSHKKFLKSLSFTGIVKGKKYCEECNFNKYQIVLKLEKTDPDEISLGNRSFQPYYFFDSENQLTISVSQSLYESASTGSLSEKHSGSEFLIIGSTKHVLLSAEKYKWLPK